MPKRKTEFPAEKFKDEWFDQYTWSVISYPEGLTPTDYLMFAELDLAEGESQRHLINAISNAKRALHLEVETICIAFGLAFPEGKITPFPKMLDFLSKCGIVKPRFLRKLNKLRNLVEHQYYTPKIGEVEDFIDVAELFINSMKLNRSRYPCEISLLKAIDNTGKFQVVEIHTDFKKSSIILKIIPIGESSAMIFCEEITSEEEEYFIWMTFILRNNG